MLMVSWVMVSKVMTALELASKARWAMIKSENSAEMFTFSRMDTETGTIVAWSSGWQVNDFRWLRSPVVTLWDRRNVTCQIVNSATGLMGNRSTLSRSTLNLLCP